MATENILMAAVALGGDRQAIHARLRQHSLAVAEELNSGVEKNDLIDRLRADPALAQLDFGKILEKKNFVGRAPQQVDEFIREVIQPIRIRFPQSVNQQSDLKI
jgi:adenylosuccinate lyase